MPPAPSPPARLSLDRRDLALALGLYLLVAVVYVLSGPGRIDQVDGQYRFEVARSLLLHGKPVLLDPTMPTTAAREAAIGRVAGYGFSPSVMAIPLMELGRLVGWKGAEAQRFLFSWLSGLLGAGIVPLQVLVHRRLGLSRQAAAAWGLATAFCTFLWAGSLSVTDQSQHAFWMMLALVGAWFAAETGRLLPAVASGLGLAVLVNHQEAYVAVFPAVLLALVPRLRERGDWRRAVGPALVIGAGLGLGLLAWLGWNTWRMGAATDSGKTGGAGVILAGPLVGAVSLLFSPGKGILFYSPPVILAVLGLRGLWARAPGLLRAILLGAAANLAIYSLMPFFGGDWCWGPRYMIPLLVLLGLAMPFATWTGPLRRGLLGTVLALGLLVQVLGLSTDHRRFFYNHAFTGEFYMEDPWVYWRASALFERPAEIVESLRWDLSEAEAFLRHPQPGALTVMTFNFDPPESAALESRKYAVYYLPRPWPAWFTMIPPEVPRPVPLQTVSYGLGLVALLAVLLVRAGLGREEARA